ncbi:uncharacterized protein C8Q71DRAFT_855613 [Rhodofomes roseus]|uniref:Uncharacterized protein n=1 Tax=Rhodofomes roseus TaxID=34475 RepID=A0ABQ8KPT9_9APHY|nr:uncharacterized protein C8Q71DRAFT_855613 [Rhodofomes roseus]KAH9840331.1 hypothetical protein C8Q71DRAFT_855613 [Rhodofomes roseus]
MAPWDDAQTKILEGSVKRFRETAGAKRDEVVAATLGLLEQVALGQLEGLTPEARTTAVRKWLVDRCSIRKEKTKQTGVMKGTIRGCDLWLDEHMEEVRREAYADGTSDPLNRFNRTWWDLWGDEDEEVRKEYKAKGKELRALVNADGCKIAPRVLPAQSLSNSLGVLCRSFERKALIENGAYCVVMYAAQTTDEGPVVGLIDHQGEHGASSNFSDGVMKNKLWSSLWDEFGEWSTTQLQKKAMVVDGTGKAGKPSKAQKKTDFGPLLSIDEETGLPLMLSGDELDSLAASGVVQKWAAIVREFLTRQYLAASNGTVSRIPWKALQTRATCLSEEMWLPDVGFADPSHMRREQMIALCRHWRTGQDGPDGVKAFQFHSFIDRTGDLTSAMYDEYFQQWTDGKPTREAERRRDAQRLQFNAEGPASPASTEAASKEQDRKASSKAARKRKPKKSAAATSKPPPKAKARKAASTKAKGKRRVTIEDESSEESPSVSEDESVPSSEVEESDESGQHSGSDESVLEMPEQAFQAGQEMLVDFAAKCPKDVSRGRKRSLFLASLSSDSRYKAVVTEYIRASMGGGVSAFKPSSITVAPWADWGWTSPSLPELPHATVDGLSRLIQFLQTEPWKRNNHASLKHVEQALLAVGLALRDLHNSQFANDPDEPPPAHVPVYVQNTLLDFHSTAEQLLDAIHPISRLLILDHPPSGPSASAAPNWTPPSPVSQSRSVEQTPDPIQMWDGEDIPCRPTLKLKRLRRAADARASKGEGSSSLQPSVHLDQASTIKQTNIQHRLPEAEQAEGSGASVIKQTNIRHELSETVPHGLSLVSAPSEGHTRLGIQQTNGDRDRLPDEAAGPSQPGNVRKETTTPSPQMESLTVETKAAGRTQVETEETELPVETIAVPSEDAALNENQGTSGSSRDHKRRAEDRDGSEEATPSMKKRRHVDETEPQAKSSAPTTSSEVMPPPPLAVPAPLPLPPMPPVQPPAPIPVQPGMGALAEPSRRSQRLSRGGQQARERQRKINLGKLHE